MVIVGDCSHMHGLHLASVNSRWMILAAVLSFPETPHICVTRKPIFVNPETKTLLQSSSFHMVDAVLIETGV